MRRGFWAGGGGALTSVGVEIEQRGAATRFTENPNLLQGGVAIFWR